MLAEYLTANGWTRDGAGDTLAELQAYFIWLDS
jgi:hypothetical protein